MQDEIRQLLVRMETLANSWENIGDKRYIFLKCYTYMSRNMGDAVQKNRFNDAQWVEKLMIVFADYYFDALYRFDHQTGNAPAIWTQAHELALKGKVNMVQNLLLGVNAHINYDLPLALYDCLCDQWNVMNEFQKESRKADHSIVNKVIAESIDIVQDDILSPQSKILKWMDKLMGRSDEWMIETMIISWRSRVWDVSQSLILNCDHDDYRQTVILQTEKDAFRKANAILLGRFPSQ